MTSGVRGGNKFLLFLYIVYLFCRPRDIHLKSNAKTVEIVAFCNVLFALTNSTKKIRRRCRILSNVKKRKPELLLTLYKRYHRK
jgi:hypothetical protein